MATGKKADESERPLYDRVAGQILELIREGTYRGGDRLPSVRALHRQLGVSVATVLGAYRLLEDRGVIVARPQSGYFVRADGVRGGGRREAAAAARVAGGMGEPAVSRPSGKSTAVSTGELVMMFLRGRGKRDLVELGMAFPPAELMPVGKLNRIMASLGRGDPRKAVDYSMPPGEEALRVQLAQRSLAMGCRLGPGDFITTCGGQEAITLCLRAVCKPGDTVAVESPMYFGVWQALEALGLRAVEVPMHPRKGMSVEGLAEAIERHPVRAVVSVPTVSNPLGSIMPDEGKREMVGLLAERGIPLIEDDIYGDLAYGEGREGAVRPRAAKAFDEKGLVLLCSSFTKTLAPGYRVGWVAGGRYAGKVSQLKAAFSLATPTLAQLTVAEFLAAGGYERYLRGLRRTLRENVGRVREAVEGSFPAGTRVTRPAGGFLLWVELPGGVDSIRLYERALAAGVTVAPGPMFSAQGRYRNFVRLNAAEWSGRVEGAVRRVGELAGKLG